MKRMLTSKEEWIFSFFLVLISLSNAAKILLLPVQTYSSCVEMAAIGEELILRGHNSTLFLTSNLNDRDCFGNKGVRALKFKAPAGPKAPKAPEKIFDQVADLLKDGEEASFSTHLKIVREMVEYHCAVIISDTRMWKHFRAEKFDFIIVDGSMFSYCYFLIPHKLRVPYAAYSTVFENYLLNTPFLPSLVPNPYSQETDSMSLFQRIRNTYRQLYSHIVMRQTIPNNVISSVAPELSTRSILQLVARSEIFLQNSDPVLGYSLPSLPNFVSIGGVTTKPGRPLPPDLQTFYEKEKFGVIIMSLGSTFKNLPMTLKHKLLQVLYKLNIPVVWKYMQDNNNRNVKSMKWFPQNDLLAHPKTKLFISHCGSNSIFEALYHGVPIICLPLYGDHFYNAARVERWGVGLSLSIVNSPETVLFSTISYALHNITFKANIKRASAIFRSRPENPRQRAAFWIEHVLRFGGGHLRSRATEMSTFTCLGYDVFIILAILFGAFQYLAYRVFKIAQVQWNLWQGNSVKIS